ncbi:MAG: ABC transporter substrate-binding protein [Deltaproteobacteria bacterium]|nr:MAG: ABC transporter substrate-binding protein [Deltaproteobacteria bacterium]
MKRHRTLTLIVSMICLMMMLITLPFVTADVHSASKPSGELRIGMPTLYTETLHPLWATNLRKFYYEPLYDYLVGLDTEMNLAPGIAFKWEESSDHLSWTFYIRDGVKFHDGTPLTLEDVKFSIETILDKRNVVARSQQVPYQKQVDIVPPNKVVVHLKKPWAVMPYLLSPAGQGGGTILPKKYLQEKGDDFERHPIGTGPYKFLEKKEGDYIKYVAQNNHWRVGAPKYRYLTFKKMSEEGTRVAALKAGELDVIMVSRKRAEELEASGVPIVRKGEAADLNLDFLRVYEPNNPLGKKKVRQALIYAIDKASILEHILMGEGKLIGHFNYMFSTSIGYKDYDVTPYDPEKAKQLLEEAGYPNGFTINHYSYATLVPEQKLIGEAIAGYWEAIGMKVKVLEMDAGAFFPVWRKKKEPPGPATFVHSWATRPQAEWSPMYHSDVKTFYFSQIKDPEMDRLIDEFNAQVTLEGYIEATRRCMDHAYEMFYKSGLASVNIPFATAKDVPKWDCGRGNVDSYRFEYIGATK